jgi:transcriptional antiterminator RfaH
MPFWAVIRTVPNHDRLAAECVPEAGFETFAPRIRTRLDAHWRTLPLFPSYLFVRIIDRWRILERTKGVLTVVRFAGAPAEVPDPMIAELIGRADADGVVRLARPGANGMRPSFAEGV